MVREDSFQRSIVNILQDMHDRLLNYNPLLINDVTDELNSGSIFGKVIKSILICKINKKLISIFIINYSYLSLEKYLKTILLIALKDYIYTVMWEQEKQC